MQHDLKIHETRMSNARLVGWCVCGGWRYVSENLHQTPMIDGFIEHLEEIAPYANLTQRYVSSPDAPL